MKKKYMKPAALVARIGTSQIMAGSFTMSDEEVTDAWVRGEERRLQPLSTHLWDEDK